MMQRFGRRPCLLISVLGACACNIGGGFCKTYSQQMATRCLTAIFISPPCALGSIVVTELFFSHQRGTKTGWWKFMFALGGPAGPFIMGFVAKYAGLKWVYFTFSFINFAVFLAYLLFAPETLYDRHAANKNNGEDFGWTATLKFHRVQRKTVSLRELLEPFQLLATLRITVPICVYAIVFAYANIAVVITMPQVFGQKFHLDAEGVGLQFIALMIGLLLGEQIGGRGSDLWMKRKMAARDGQRVIEDRLWLAYLGFVCVIVGLVIWGVRMQQAAPLRWNVTPDVGAAIDSVGCQIVTTVLITYAIDVNPARAADTGLMLNLIRQTWGFVSSPTLLFRPSR
jgi:MFS family permease